MAHQLRRQDPALRECIDACTATHEAALRTLARLGGDTDASPEFFRLLVDCAEISQTAANFMLRGSELHHETCKACEEVCEALIEATQTSGLDDIDDFRTTLRTCADNCRDMAAAGGRSPSQGNFERRGSSRRSRGRAARTERTSTVTRRP